jgi:type IV pilus assembly protein PilQ
MLNKRFCAKGFGPNNGCGCLLAAMLLVGCAGNSVASKAKTDPFMDQWKQTAQASKGSVPAPRKVQMDLSAPQPEEGAAAAAPQTPTQLLPTTSITLKMNNIEVAVLLRALARAANQNIIINEKVKGTANINIRQAPWDQVFVGILKTHGLDYAWEGDILRVMTVEDMENDLKKQAINEQKKVQQNVLQQVAPLLGPQIVKINYAEAAKLKESLEKLLITDKDGKPRGSIMVDTHTNSLIIKATGEDLARMAALIETLDRPTPQVLIEAHIVEATRSTSRQLGVQWGGLYKHTSGDGVNHWVTPGANTGIGTPLSPGGIAPVTGMAANFPATLGLGQGFSLGYIAERVGESVLAIQLSALQRDGKVNILSSPSITTLDNQEATIESGREVPYQSVDDGNVKVEFKKAVLSLKVTPHVIGDNSLKLVIQTKNDEVDKANAVGGQPAISTKSATTNVVLFDGQTTVIGGLSKKNTSDADDGVPWLKEIPLLGYFFKGEVKSDALEDLLIFITPYILKEKPPASAASEADASLPEGQNRPPSGTP